MNEMRRKDRKMDEDFAWSVFDRSDCQVLATVNKDGTPYAVPLSCARIGKDIYFHCAKEGQKIENMINQEDVCITAVGEIHIPTGKFTTEFESCILCGKASFVEGAEEKKEALRAICMRYTPENMNRFEEAIEKSMKITAIVKIEISTVSGKRKKYGKDGKELKYGAIEK